MKESQIGTVWALGPHRLICGDATDPAVIERLLQGERAAMIWTDPPYNVDHGARARNKGGKVPGRILNDKLAGPAFAAFLRRACDAMLPVCDGAAFICMSSAELATLRTAFVGAGGHASTFIIWVKSHFALSWGDMHRRYEPILYGWRRGAKRQWHGGRRQDDVWHCKLPPPRSRIHPTEKPVDLIARAIGNSSSPGNLVLDPFAGSGSTIEACHRLGRHARLVELDPRWCDAIRRRWAALGGEEVEL